MTVAVFLFRRDLRTQDNIALGQCRDIARATKSKILPIFAFNPRQVDRRLNKYFGQPAYDFMLESLAELRGSLPGMACVEGDDRVVLDKVHAAVGVSAVAFNSDYTPYARQRDEAIADWCKRHDVPCVTNYADYSLVDPRAMSKPYQRFTPFANRYSLDSLTARIEITTKSATKVVPGDFVPSPPAYLRSCASTRLEKIGATAASASKLRGGRTAALRIVRMIERGAFSDYATTRNEPSLTNGTTRLSPYLKFGCVSVREVLAAIVESGSKDLFRELMWRAFYDQVAFHFPRVLQGQVTMRGNFAKYDDHEWRTSNKDFEAWCAGRTGVPFVDAGMRQLNATGYMHNRLRMVTASFLVKNLRIDWRRGERYFATRLIDYHPSANSGGWQWVAAVGVDAPPYSRTMSPWRQAERFDPQCVYIRRWIPELDPVPARSVLAWSKVHEAFENVTQYPAPILRDGARR